ncbi:MAG: hypothetical protein SGJ18_00750 [Pseudomonadota bacterium]|nr:hypothetical protein [Pseudomonadota bacterium]
MIRTLSFLAIVFPVVAFGHGNTIDATNDSVVQALKVFKETESDQTKTNFTGLKAWPNGDMIMVKVYVTTSGTESSVNYMCMMDHQGGSEKINCTKQ